MTPTETAPQPWRAVGTVAALAMSAGALVFSGAVALGFGMHWIGIGMMASGASFLVAASFMEV